MTDTAPFDAAPQHGPRPLPLFLDLLHSETAASPERMTMALAGLRAYQDAARQARPAPMPVLASAGRACLRDYGGDGRPVIFVPSLINPPFILDLTETNSMLRWMRNQGVRPLLLDWGEPLDEERDLDIAGHIERFLLPLIDAVGERPALAGYCLGGTMAIAAAALRPVTGLALIAAPWNFNGFPSAARADMLALWATARPGCEAIGYLPMEVLQTAFWRLDPARTIAKYEAFAALDSASDAAGNFVALEDWANGGAPLTFGAGREAFEAFFGSDTPGQGAWLVGGKQILPETITCPVLDIVSLRDKIVPAATATGLADRIELDAGHVGMVIGRSAQQTLWQPLARWLSQLQHEW
ncbi:alpha/beta fold hydrolase [Sphingomonas cavernae]|uniref:Alpha/beta hydrolase n=1 Tax=Sphingomonas cavernae TaxID=2320861 RepID=A0A418W6C0_9SPHN|nr:alpha/beta fold hydrolase [Sphingomonas cavernae]RJF85549.1 alpha/beta hydrolase [Sphingomonas cavernae]